LSSFWQTTRPYKVEAIVVYDEPDTATPEEILGLEWVKGVMTPGDSMLGKPQDKFNIGYANCTGNWIVTGSDDIEFMTPGWIDKALAVQRKGFVGLWDGYHDPNGIAILVVASREYIDTVMCGKVGLPWYFLWFADVEWAERARRAEAFVVCQEALITHHHHVYGRAAVDAIYAMNTQARQRQDEQVYMQRLAENFPDPWHAP
jgi:hypothetical protein